MTQNNDDDVRSHPELPLRYSYVTSSNKTANDCHTDTTHDFLVGVANTVGVNVESECDEYNKSKSARSEHPLNEFENGDMVLAGAWPDVFFLGTAKLGEKASPSEKKCQTFVDAIHYLSC